MEITEFLRNKDIKAFEVLTLPHQKKVYHMMLCMCKNRRRASELAQQIFVRAFSSADRFHSESDLSAWVFKEAVRECSKLAACGENTGLDVYKKR